MSNLTTRQFLRYVSHEESEVIQQERTIRALRDEVRLLRQ